MAVHRIMFVCAYNVCRSPYLAAAMASRIAGNAKSAEWSISSRGTIGPDRAAMCEVAASRLPAAVEQFAKTHVSRRVRTADIVSSHLILTATRAERSFIASLSPEARSRTFTLREAILLGQKPVTEGERREVVVPGRSAASLRTYAEALNRRRGTLAVLEPKRTLPWRKASDPLDQPDTHTQSKKEHERMFPRLDADIAALLAEIDEFAPSVED